MNLNRLRKWESSKSNGKWGNQNCSYYLKSNTQPYKETLERKNWINALTARLKTLHAWWTMRTKFGRSCHKATTKSLYSNFEQMLAHFTKNHLVVLCYSFHYQRWDLRSWLVRKLVGQYLTFLKLNFGVSLGMKLLINVS